MRRAHGCPRLPILVELEITRARPGQPAGGVTLVDSRGLHAFCAPPHTLLVLVPYISQSAVPVLQLQVVGSRIADLLGAAGSRISACRHSAKVNFHLFSFFPNCNFVENE